MVAQAVLVKRAVAIPLLWMVACCAEKLPLVALAHVTGRPISGLINAVVSALPKLFCKKLAVRVLDCAPLTDVGDAVVLSTTHDESVNAPPLLSAWSHPVPLTGPPLQPHQLLLALAVPARTPNPSLFVIPALLPTNRLVTVLPRLRVPPPK